MRKWLARAKERGLEEWSVVTEKRRERSEREREIGRERNGLWSKV